MPCDQSERNGNGTTATPSGRRSLTTADGGTGAHRTSRALRGASLAVALVGLVHLPFSALPPGTRSALVATGVVAGLLLGCAALVDRGRVHLGTGLALLAVSGAALVAPASAGSWGAAPVLLLLLVPLAGSTLRPLWIASAWFLALVTLALLPLVVPARAPVEGGALLASVALVVSATALPFAVAGRVLGGALAAATRARTEAEHLADRLREANVRLEERVAERTRELEAALRLTEEQVRRLNELSLRDPLTGLHNRRHLDGELERLFARASAAAPLALAVVDLDHFKSVNDAHGHLVGDAVLRVVGSLLVEHVRAGDVVARSGGEEFVLLMPDTDVEEAAAACERLRTLVSAHPWDSVHPGLRVTLSAGVTDSRVHPAAADQLRAADRLLYLAKSSGRDQVRAEVVRACDGLPPTPRGGRRSHPATRYEG